MDNKKTIDNDKIYKNYFFDVINSLSTNSKCIKHNKLNLNHESITVRAQRDANENSIESHHRICFNMA